MNRIMIARSTLFSLLFAICASCQAASDGTLAYIERAWDSLSRSMNDCTTVADTKTADRPVLYLPAGMDVPSAAAKLSEACGVDVRNLPRRIASLGDLKPDELPAQ